MIANAKQIPNGENELVKFDLIKKETRIKNMVQREDGNTHFIHSHTDVCHSHVINKSLNTYHERINARTNQTFKAIQRSIKKVKDDIAKN